MLRITSFTAHHLHARHVEALGSANVADHHHHLAAPAHLVALAGIGLPVLVGLLARTRYRPAHQTRLSVMACAGYLTAAGVIAVESLLSLPVLIPAGVVVAGLGATALLTVVVAVGYGLLGRPAQPATGPTPAPPPR